MYQKSFDHQLPIWDSYIRSHTMSLLAWAWAVLTIEGDVTAVPRRSLTRWEAVAPKAADTQSRSISRQLRSTGAR